LSELWANVALAPRPFDSDLAERCYIKSNYWANPDNWSGVEILTGENGATDARSSKRQQGK